MQAERSSTASDSTALNDVTFRKIKRLEGKYDGGVYGFGYRENWHRMSELGINSEVEKNP
jgi:hypothetical protein